MNTHTKKVVIILGLMTAATFTQAQTAGKTTVRPYFAGIIVSDIDSSIYWYQKLLNLTVKTKDYKEDEGYKVGILESPDMLIELLELKGSLSQKDLLQAPSRETRIQGHFKIGFKVSDMDQFIAHLSTLKLKTGRVWKDEKTGKRNFIVTDPDGNLIQFFD